MVLFDRSVQSDRKLPFRNFRFQSRSSSSLHTVVKRADGSDVSVCECSVCKLQTQDLHFLLMHSCTQGSGTAVICFFFWYSSLFKDKYITGFSVFRRCFPAFFSWQYVTLALRTIPNDQFGWTFGSIFPWLVQLVSDRSVRYNRKHPLTRSPKTSPKYR